MVFFSGSRDAIRPDGWESGEILAQASKQASKLGPSGGGGAHPSGTGGSLVPTSLCFSGSLLFSVVFHRLKIFAPSFPVPVSRQRDAGRVLPPLPIFCGESPCSSRSASKRSHPFRMIRRSPRIEHHAARSLPRKNDCRGPEPKFFMTGGRP